MKILSPGTIGLALALVTAIICGWLGWPPLIYVVAAVCIGMLTGCIWSMVETWKRRPKSIEIEEEQRP
jgi:hypothetical protein